MSSPLISFDSSHWQARGEVAPGIWVWYTPEGDGVGLYEFTEPPDIPAAATFDEFRTQSEQSGGPYVELAIVEVSGRSLIRRIVKAPQQPTGMTYVASLTLPFTDSSFVLKVQCEERGVTGWRETMLLDRLLAEGSVRIGTDGQPEGAWDPDDVGYDSQFPDHPVARARRVLNRLERSIVLDPALHSKPAFPLPR